MTTEAATVVLAVLTGMALVVWAIGLRFLLASYPPRVAAPIEERFGVDRAARPEAQFTGEVEVDGQPDALAAKTLSALVKDNALGLVKILERTGTKLVFETLASNDSNQVETRGSQRFELRFRPARQDRTAVGWSVGVGGSAWLLQLGALFQVLGLLAIVIGSGLLHAYCVRSPDPVVRWQTLEMVQVAHFLWPPFLFGVIYRAGPRAAAARLEAPLTNLPYRPD